jgi:uncharacterized protein (TIGR03435 family)
LPCSPYEDSPGRFSQCGSLASFIQTAYAFSEQSAKRQLHIKLQIIGGPAWIGSFSNLYDITAKANGPASSEQMSGPMLQMLLENRFKLRIHRETRQLSVYTLTVAKGGTKLKPLKEGSCPPPEAAPPATASARENAKALSEAIRGKKVAGAPEKCPAEWVDGNGPNTSVDIHGESMAEFAVTLSRMDHPVIDQTGLKGLFDIHLKFAHDEPGESPNSAAPAHGDWGVSIFAAMQQQLGLKLSPATGPVEVLVIDHAERPSEN